MGSNDTNQLQKVFEVQESIREIHPFLEKVFPIAVVEDGYFFIYDLDSDLDQYTFVTKAAAPMPIPPGVRAAFELESYADRMACVVTGEVFDDLVGYTTIFHEFMHCQQAEICEQQLKGGLSIARKAKAAQDYMWEIAHPFPYAAPVFVRLYETFLKAQEMPEVEDIRYELQTILNQEDYEYMVWQEWKEGFARFIENQIRYKLSLPENHSGNEKPFNRVVFYEGGEKYIKLLSKQEPGLDINIENLFRRMFRG